MHPLAIMGIIAGGLIFCYGGYQAAHTLYEWHNDRKEQREYEEYVRMHAEKGRYFPSAVFHDEAVNDSDDDDQDDNEPLGIWKQKRDSFNNNSELRHRNISLQHAEQLQNSPPSYEFHEMEKSISKRRSLLEKEAEVLQKDAAELERRKSLLQSKGNSITGVFNDDSDNEQDPFSESFIDQQKIINQDSYEDLIINKRQDSLTEDKPKNSQNPFTDSVIVEEPENSSSRSNISSIADDDKNVLSQSNEYQLLYQQPAISNPASDLDGSWSDLNEDFMEESSDNNHHRTDSNESFEHVKK